MIYKGITWTLSLYIAVVFVQSLFFKFTDAPETVYIFSTLGSWLGLQWFTDYGAYTVGVVELVASVFLLTRFRMYGAAVAVCVMLGAVFFHLFTPLGVAIPAFNETDTIVGDDGGLLFYNAVGLLFSGFILMILEFINTDNKIKKYFQKQ